MDKNELKYKILLPNPNDPEGPWIVYDRYATKAEALASARHHFGADENGKLDIISGPESED